MKIVPSTAIEGQMVMLTCDTVTQCSLTDNPTYVWYQNGQQLPNHTEQQIVVGPVCGREAGDYSCSVKGLEDERAPDRILTVRCE